MKKPAPGLTGPALAAHKAHLAHLAHLARLGLRPKGAPPAAKKKTAPKKKPAAKKPAPGLAGPALAAHKAHLAHLAHLARLGLKPKAAPVRQRRQLALGEGVACCAAEALAASLRLAGRTVSDTDVLALYRRTAGDPDTGASIMATLEVAARYGVAGYFVADFRPASLEEVTPHDPDRCWCQSAYCTGLRASRAGLILGVDLPGPHAVLDDGSSWWSWGEPHDPACWPDAVIEEAWAVTWG